MSFKHIFHDILALTTEEGIMIKRYDLVLPLNTSGERARKLPAKKRIHAAAKICILRLVPWNVSLYRVIETYFREYYNFHVSKGPYDQG